MALNIGDRLGHYDVIALIGQGGMGEVYRAKDTKPTTAGGEPIRPGFLTLVRNAQEGYPMAPDIGRVTLLRPRILTVTLVVALVSMGVPVPVNASGEQEQPSARNRVLTRNGQPIRQFVSTTGRSRDAVLFSGLTQAQPSNSQISGVVIDQDGQPLGAQRVELRRILDAGGLGGVQVVGTTTSDANGQFSFTGLTAGTFEVEVLSDEDLVSWRVTPVLLLAGEVVSGITVYKVEPADERFPLVEVSVGLSGLINPSDTVLGLYLDVVGNATDLLGLVGGVNYMYGLRPPQGGRVEGSVRLDTLRTFAFGPRWSTRDYYGGRQSLNGFAQVLVGVASSSLDAEVLGERVREDHTDVMLLAGVGLNIWTGESADHVEGAYFRVDLGYQHVFSDFKGTSANGFRAALGLTFTSALFR